MKTDLNRLDVFYASYVKDHPNGGGWPNTQVAFDVYKASTMSDLIDWNSLETITDVGCGVGNLLKFVRGEYNYQKQYLGIEAVDFFYNSAVRSFESDPLSEFIHDDFLNIGTGALKKTDWVFCIGTLSTMQDNKVDYDKIFLKGLREIARKGITIYINDDRYMSQERLKQLPELVAHNVDSFLKLISASFEYKDLEIIRFPNTDLTSCAVTILLS